MIRRKGDRDEAEALIEDLLGEVVELRAEVERLRRPSAPVVDLAAHRKKGKGQ